MFGNSIMSTVDFEIDIQKKEDPKGDCIVIIYNAKFLPYRKREETSLKRDTTWPIFDNARRSETSISMRLALRLICSRYLRPFCPVLLDTS